MLPDIATQNVEHPLGVCRRQMTRITTVPSRTTLSTAVCVPGSDAAGRQVQESALREDRDCRPAAPLVVGAASSVTSGPRSFCSTSSTARPPTGRPPADLPDRERQSVKVSALVTQSRVSTAPATSRRNNAKARSGAEALISDSASTVSSWHSTSPTASASMS